MKAAAGSLGVSSQSVATMGAIGAGQKADYRTGALRGQATNFAHQDPTLSGDGSGDALHVTSPWVYGPAGGAVLGGLMAGDSGSWLKDRVRGATKGLLTGLGGALGQAAGGAITRGDLASRILGGGLGATGAYLASSALMPSPKKKKREEEDED